MTDKKELVKDFIQNNPSLSGIEAYKKTVENGYGIRKQDFYKEYRKIKNLPEPSIKKREQSVPIKYRKVKEIKYVKGKLKFYLKGFSVGKQWIKKMSKENALELKQLSNYDNYSNKENYQWNKDNQKEAKRLYNEYLSIVKPPKPPKPPIIPYEQTKFGKMAKDIQDKHGISERKAIERTRALLKIPKRDYRKLNQKDFDVLTQYGY